MHYRIFSHIPGASQLDGRSTSRVSADIANGLLGAESLLVKDGFTNPSLSLLLAFLLVCRSLSADKLQGFPKLGKRHLEYFPREKCGMIVMGWITILLHSGPLRDRGKTKQNIQAKCRQVLREKCGLRDGGSWGLSALETSFVPNAPQWNTPFL